MSNQQTTLVISGWEPVKENQLYRAPEPVLVGCPSRICAMQPYLEIGRYLLPTAHEVMDYIQKSARDLVERLDASNPKNTPIDNLVQLVVWKMYSETSSELFLDLSRGDLQYQNVIEAHLQLASGYLSLESDRKSYLTLEYKLLPLAFPFSPEDAIPSWGASLLYEGKLPDFSAINKHLKNRRNSRLIKISPENYETEEVRKVLLKIYAQAPTPSQVENLKDESAFFLQGLAAKTLHDSYSTLVKEHRRRKSELRRELEFVLKNPPNSFAFFLLQPRS